MGALKWLGLSLLVSGCNGFVDGNAAPGAMPGPTQQGGSSGSGGTGVIDPTAAPPPGAPVLRRLNQREYANTVRDLFGTALEPAKSFPADDTGAEFTTVGSALSLSPGYVRAYETAAYQLVDELFSVGHEANLATIVTCAVDTGGDVCAQEILSKFAARAWRRPVTDAEAQALMAPIAAGKLAGATPVESLKHALAAVLLSPHFIFKLELDAPGQEHTAHALAPHELATRLSYALWGTTPDAELRRAADAGELASDVAFAAQVDRLLADAKSDALVEGFAAEWLGLGNLATHEVEPTLYPMYTPELGQAMAAEAKAYFAELLQSARPATDLFTAPYTYVNQPLADLYGLPMPSATPQASGLARVDTTGTARGGLLTLGALLTATSYPTRTSPVKRGEFVFARFSCGEVPSPPMDVPALPPDTPGLTLRERTELHRASPSCAGCHALMDPLGFGLENYDAIGRYRTTDAGEPIDSSGILPDGQAFNGALELGAILAADPQTTKCLTRKLLTYSVGRLFHGDDDAWVESLTNEAAQAGGTIKATIRAITLSAPFRQRQLPQE